MPGSGSSTPQTGRMARVSTYIVTNGTKVMGVYLIVKEQAKDTVRDSVLIAAVLLALGAQTAEAIILAAIDRFFGGDRSK